MFMEHTDRMVFTKEDADLLERYCRKDTLNRLTSKRNV